MPCFQQDEKPETTQIKMDSDPAKAGGKDSEEAGPVKADADEGSSTALPGAEGDKPEHDEQQDSKETSG